MGAWVTQAEIDRYYECQPYRHSQLWDLFESEYGREIQRIDDPGSIGLDGEPLADDLLAVELVLIGAIEGHPCCLQALDFIGYKSEVFGSYEAALEVVRFAIRTDDLDDPRWDQLNASRVWLNHKEEEVTNTV